MDVARFFPFRTVILFHSVVLLLKSLRISDLSKYHWPGVIVSDTFSHTKVENPSEFMSPLVDTLARHD
jgi:hypothetical protein